MIFGLSIVLVLVFVIGKANIINCQKVQQSIHGINDDRLVVMGFIVDLYSAVHQKELAAITADRDFYADHNSRLNESLRELITKFQATILTMDERRALESFQRNTENLIRAEARLDLQGEKLKESDAKSMLRVIASLKSDLKTLSSIQTEEGDRQLRLSVKASEGMTWTSWIGKFTAILILLIMIGVVFVQPGRE